MKSIFFRIILFLGVFIFCSADSYAYEDLTTKITKAYANHAGGLLIQTEAAHGSPGTWLKVTQDNQVSNPAAKMMYSVALIAVTTGKMCWVRIVPTEDGYWITDRISIHQ